MKALALGFALALAAPAWAGEPQMPSRYTLDLTAQEVDYLGGLLEEQKLKDALPLWNKIQGQIREQALRASAEGAAGGKKTDEKFAK